MQKRGAIELSIGTIVILVIAISMLILGIIFVRSIMCAGIGVSEDLSAGVKNEIATLFGADKYGVRCAGEGSQEVKIGSGGKRKIICIIKTDQQSEYSLKTDVTVLGKGGAPQSTVEKWILQDEWEGQVSPGGSGTEAVALYLDIPRDAPTTTIQLKVDAENKETGTSTTHTAEIEIVPVGYFKTTLC